MVAVDKAVIPVFHGVVFDTVTAHDIDLHPVIRHEIVSAPAGNLPGGIVKQIIHIKDKEVRGREIIVEEPGPYIDGGIKVNAIIPKIDQADPFVEGKR